MKREEIFKYAVKCGSSSVRWSLGNFFSFRCSWLYVWALGFSLCLHVLFPRLYSLVCNAFKIHDFMQMKICLPWWSAPSIASNFKRIQTAWRQIHRVTRLTKMNIFRLNDERIDDDGNDDNNGIFFITAENWVKMLAHSNDKIII